MEQGNQQGGVFDIELSAIGETWGRLRLVCPVAEACIERSMIRHGQLSPVLVLGGEDGVFQMLDGFKRLRVARKLGTFPRLHAELFSGSPRVGKVAMLQRNGAVRAVCDFEEALILDSLCRDDLMNQAEVAILVGRDKSWVSRRLALVRKLTPEVQEHLRLGLLSGTAAKEIAKLPRGNQTMAIETIGEWKLSSREVRQLVARVQTAPRGEQEILLRRPTFIIEDRGRPVTNAPVKSILPLAERLELLAERCSAITSTVETLGQHACSESERLAYLAASHPVLAALRKTTRAVMRGVRLCQGEAGNGSGENAARLGT